MPNRVFTQSKLRPSDGSNKRYNTPRFGAVKLDIVITGAVGPWDVSQGQRWVQLTREFVEMGHRVLCFEPGGVGQRSEFFDHVSLANVLPRHWIRYDMEDRTEMTSNPSILARAGAFFYQIGNTWFGRLVIHAMQAILPARIYSRLVSKALRVVPLRNDLPSIRERTAAVLDGFCRPDSMRLVLFESPMRCYVECLDLFRERNFAVVYELIDRWELMWGGEKVRRLADEKKLVSQAELVTAVTKSLKEELMTLYPWRKHILYLPNAVRRDVFDIEHFSGETFHKPGEITVGFFGRIAEYVDVEALEFLVDQKPNWSFVIIGEYLRTPNFPEAAWRRIARKANVFLLGPKKQSELIRYLATWDVCIIPFIKSFRNATPVKVYEYLSSYKPVAIFESNEMRGFPFVYHAKNKEELLARVEEAMKVPVDREIVDRFLEENTWRNRATAILNATGNLQQEAHSGVRKPC
jgi:glycosyltransferase involved in cell wall biosynthesis